MKKYRIDLDSPQGNAWYFIGLASKLGKENGDTKQEIEAFRTQLMAGNYSELVATFLEKYGDMVEID